MSSFLGCIPYVHPTNAVIVCVLCFDTIPGSAQLHEGILPQQGQSTTSGVKHSSPGVSVVCALTTIVLVPVFVNWSECCMHTDNNSTCYLEVIAHGLCKASMRLEHH